jgi:hypothetical protein
MEFKIRMTKGCVFWIASPQAARNDGGRTYMMKDMN